MSNEFYNYIEELWAVIPTETLTELVDYIDSLGHIDILRIDMTSPAYLILTSTRFPGQYLKLEYCLDSYTTDSIYVNGNIEYALSVVEKKDKMVTIYE
jgi:hypothetical protein